MTEPQDKWEALLCQISDDTFVAIRNDLTGISEDDDRVTSAMALNAVVHGLLAAVPSLPDLVRETMVVVPREPNTDALNAAFTSTYTTGAELWPLLLAAAENYHD